MPSLQWARHPESNEIPVNSAASPKSQRSDLDSPWAMQSKSALRPAGSLQRRSSANTRYMNMLLELDAVPRFHNMLASFFTWILLAGFVIFPDSLLILSCAPRSLLNMTAYPLYDATTSGLVYYVAPDSQPNGADLESEIGSETESTASGLTIHSDNILDYFIEHHGRQQPASENAIRFFPSDNTRRYILRHIIGKYLFGGNYDGLVKDMLTSDPRRGFNVLELGTRDGTWAQDMATEFPNVQFRSLDLVPVMAHAPRSNVAFEVYDFAAELLLDDSSQDVVFINVAAELVKDYRALLREVHRVLRPGGVVHMREYNLRLWDPQDSPRPIRSMKPATCRITDIARGVLERLGGEPDICDKIPRWLEPSSSTWSHIGLIEPKGFERINMTTKAYPAYPHEGHPCASKLDPRIVPVLAHYATTTVRDMFSILRDGGMTAEEATEIIEASIEELKDPRRCSLSRLCCIQAVKKS
ncbi:methyltransferase domain protein [Rhizoctonia solani AG-3 Rhs1AP]|uniref:Methyltransferase domain protein n=1 Tax=Rhizoctonia solani AG-3 Rhs1AP TaxID=1086054 RepID=X8JCE9_9AGAM|nr:methyltransferase domain protein [Rhizoctonia solani AG-3 Rhs1AP]